MHSCLIISQKKKQKQKQQKKTTKKQESQKFYSEETTGLEEADHNHNSVGILLNVNQKITHSLQILSSISSSSVKLLVDHNKRSASKKHHMLLNKPL